MNPFGAAKAVDSRVGIGVPGIGPVGRGAMVETEVQLNRERVRRAGTLSAVAAFALIVLAACGGEPSLEEELEDVTRVPTMSDAAAQATTTAPDEASTPGAAGDTPASDAASPEAGDQGATATAEVVSFDIYFEPKTLTIPANTDVTVMLPNEGVTAHNFSIDALGIDVDLAPGATGEAVINAPVGEYEFYCNVPGHKEAGMVGIVTVSEDAAATGGAATPDAPPDAGASPASSVAAEVPAASPVAATPVATAAASPIAATSTMATPAVATPAAGAASPAAETPAAGAEESVEVVSRDIFFEPTEVAIAADTDVTFSLPNEGVTAHNFSIDALEIDVDQAPGSTEEIVINAPAGTYEYYCNVPGHKAAGMVGTLTVE